MRATRAAQLALVVLAVTACGRPAPEPRLRPVESPVPPGGKYPALYVDEERIALSWIEPAGEEPEALPRVRLAVHEGDGWGAAETVAASADLMINWADFPSVVLDGEGRAAAQWLVRGGGPSWAYGIRFAVRRGAGEPWPVPQIPHRRPHPAEHGFVSMLPAENGAFDLVWLDGREMESGGTMELRHARWGGERFGPEKILDADVCTCCQTDAVRVADQTLVVYRDHTPGEIRDISLVRHDGRGWEAPRTLSRDGWRIAACPVNGPAIDARDRRVVVVWFTQAQDDPRVLAVVSEDAGAVWSDPIRLDDGNPIGRVDVAMLDDGSWVASWLENRGTDTTVRLRRVGTRGRPDAPLVLGATGAHRGSGFPRIDSRGSTLWATWTETSRPERVHLVQVDW